MGDAAPSKGYRGQLVADRIRIWYMMRPIEWTRILVVENQFLTLMSRRLVWHPSGSRSHKNQTKLFEGKRTIICTQAKRLIH